MGPQSSDRVGKSYGPWIRAARERAAMTMDEASKRAGVTSDGLSRIERGINGAKLATLERLAEVYGVEIGDLLPHTSSVQSEFAQPLLAALAGLDADEIGAWINQYAQMASLQRSHIERHAAKLAGRNTSSSNVVQFPQPEPPHEMTDDAMEKLTAVLKEAGFEERKAARGREYDSRFYAEASAGEGIELFDDADIPDEYRQIPQWAWKKGARGVVKVNGWSMVDAGIMDGSIVFVKPTPEPPNGATVICIINRVVYIKKLKRDARGVPVQLVPKAPGYKTIDIGPDDVVQFFGVAIGTAGDL